MNSKSANSGVLVPSDEFSSRRRTLHVLTLTPFYPSAGDDVNGCFVAEMLQQLKQEDVESIVIAVGALHHPLKVANKTTPADWIRFPQFPGIAGLSSAGRLLYLRLRGRVQRLHQQRHVDLIHAHAALPCGDAANRLSNQLGIPFVVTVHGLDAFNTCLVDGVAAGWRRKVSREVYARAQSVICVSRKVEQVVKAGVGEEARATVVYNGTDTEFFSPDPATNRNERCILVVGNLLPSKGQKLVLEAAARLQNSYPDLCIDFIGDGRDRTSLQQLARDLGIEDRVTFLGRQGRAEVAATMRRCTLFVLPSNNEALGCVYLEAMASELPVVACRGQGIDEIIRHQKNGWLIGDNNLEELVQALFALLQNPRMRIDIGAEARRTVLAGLTMSDQGKRMRAIYEDAVR